MGLHMSKLYASHSQGLALAGIGAPVRGNGRNVGVVLVPMVSCTRCQLRPSLSLETGSAKEPI